MSQENLIAINIDPWETRVAIIEEGMIAELLVERSHQTSRVGKVYRGRVTRVLPGMQAAFVDIGLEKHAFMTVHNVGPTGDNTGKKKKGSSISDALKEGQYIIVQVSKDQISTKGCRITGDVTLAGRHLVYMPTAHKGGVSRKIENDKERKRLGRILSQIECDGALIARTAAQDASAEALKADAEYLQECWANIQKTFSKKRKPALLYDDLHLALRVARDKFNDKVAKLIVDDAQIHKELMELMGRLAPERVSDIEHYSGDEPIFDAFGIESEIQRALERVVELPSGGSLIIDQGEALTAVDVNTGKFVGKGSKDQEETIFQTNLEAVTEIAYQVRFRNIGGLIVLDLIDMEKAAHRQKVTDQLKTLLKNDRAKTSVTDISRFGLLEMTRERTTESLGRTLHEPCPYCDGTGHILSTTSTASEAMREVRRIADQSITATLQLVVHPHVAKALKGELAPAFSTLKKQIGRKIEIVEEKSKHQEQFQILFRKPHRSRRPKKDGTVKTQS